MGNDKLNPEIEATRKTNYPVNPIIHNRWSPRSMTGEEISGSELMPLFEAARLAPSSYNNQPWRFLYARRNTPSWNLFFEILGDFNKSWCKNASVLVVVISRTTFEHNNKPSVTNAFDTGAAWMSLALEATSRGLVTHGMEGFDYDKARKDLEIPTGFQVLAMIAIGKLAPKEKLPAELQAREAPSERKPLNTRVLEGKFKFTA